MPKPYRRFEDYSWSTQNSLKRKWLDKTSTEEETSDDDSYDEESENEASALPRVKLPRLVTIHGQAEKLPQQVRQNREVDRQAFAQENPTFLEDSNCESSSPCQSPVPNENSSIRAVSGPDSESETPHKTEEILNSELGYYQSGDSFTESASDNSDSEASEAETSSKDSSLNESIESELLSSDNEVSEPESIDSENGVTDRGRNRVRNDDDEPLYEGAPLTVSESLIATLSLALRHNITGVLLSDILALIALHCPPDNKCKASLYTFRKCFSEMQAPLIRHYYCGECYGEVEHRESECPSCPESKISYFIEGQINAQLKSLYKRPGFHDLLQHRHNRNRDNVEDYADIYEGSVYKDLSQPGGFLANPANISLTWYSDGILIFKSSKFDIWVVYLVINELPYSERFKKENILLAGIWFGEEKPIPNLFLEPLLESVNELNRGIDVDLPNTNVPLSVKGIVICGTCDLPAKALFLNMKQYNGKFGCQICKQEGVYLRNERVRVYPYEPINLRTDEESQTHVQQAIDSGTAVCGIKGPTILSAIVHQNMRAVAVDPMHSIFEGTVKRLVKFWFSPDWSDHPSSLIEHVDLVDERLRVLTPPSSVQRLPRSIKNHLSYWKAHEFKCWFYYYSVPCVNDIMDTEYFRHYQSLVLGVSLLSQTTVTPEEIEIADRALNEFVAGFENLYHLPNMSNNLHQLLHLADNVRKFGPLWTTSCFPLEDLNGKFKSMVHGSNAPQLQMFSTASMLMQLTSLKSEKLSQDRPAYEFCQNLDFKRGRVKRHPVSDSVYIVGKSNELKLLPHDLAQVFRNANVHGTRYSYYQRLLKNKAMFTSFDYRRSGRTNSSFAAYYNQAGLPQIGQIRYFVRVSNCACHDFCTTCVAHNYAILRPCRTENQFSTGIDDTPLNRVHTFLQFEENEEAVDISSLKCVCFYCSIPDTSVKYLIEPVNLVEFE